MAGRPRLADSPIRTANRKKQNRWRTKNPSYMSDYMRNWRVKNRDRWLARMKEWRKKNPDKVRANNLRVAIEVYGISVDEYKALLKAQGGHCALCSKRPDPLSKKNRRLPIDHDHKTGKVRGLLCHRCNLFLGVFERDPSWVERAARYLEKSSQNNRKEIRQ